jgi:hypothetical protein
MITLLRHSLSTLLTLVLLGFACSLAAPPAQADVGVERVSRSAGQVGDSVDLTIGCGFCFPPCHGAPGQRNAPCMLDTKAPPPEAFPVSLVPTGKAPAPHRCGPRALCSPQVLGPPGHPPFTFLGEATPPAAAEIRSGHHVPRYLLHFEIPSLRPGLYAFVIFCDACTPGKRGSLIASPGSPGWQLRVWR